MQKVIRNKWLSVLVAVLLVVAPLNLFWQIPLGSAYVNGLRVDYLIPKLYVSWLVTLVVIGLNLVTKLSLPSRRVLYTWVTSNWLILLFSILVFVRQVLTERPESALMHFLWLITAVGLVRAFSSTGVTQVAIVLGSGVSLGLQLLIGWWQLIQQRSFAAYHWLGETNLSNWFGIAKGEWFGREITLPYGTTAHPNILANSLVILWWFTWLGIKPYLYKPAKNPTEQVLIVAWLISSLLSIGLIISTQSSTGIVAGCLAIALAIVSSLKPTISRTTAHAVRWISVILIVAAPLVMSFLQSSNIAITQQLSWVRRTELFDRSTLIVKQQPIWGIGLAQSSIFLSGVGGTSEVVRFVQPVHNLFWLILVETGLVGVLSALMILRRYLVHQPSIISIYSLAWILLVPAAALDHFWFTQWPGLLLAALLLSTSNKKELR